MAKFGRLKKLDIGGRTIEFVLEEAHVPDFCDDPPVLHLAHMGRANKAWFNARMALSAKGMAAAVKGKNTKAKAMSAATEFATKEASSFDRDRELMPLYIIKGWDNMFDDDGSQVSFSKESAAELLAELPDDVIESMRDDAGDVQAFRLTIEPTPEEVEVALGNSLSD